ncbi:nucleoredoxin-like protein 1 [Sphaerodactylus townsendi]|uniref:Nucleoredoxin-like protein 1 n=1 Tax=Sphaerodactylus townsendi TaxID=933632 RepID=A0ACB8EM04_9SAUR|nr:nucleoredoxin-like protein 1 [Sphaerodactylus townsendi]XP_048346446.1 nucleoredoxin-like protein 1 [Sphaerodactylus townsendi]
MVSLFTDKTLIVNNKDNDELELERELIRALENKVIVLYFGSGECPRCQEFTPILKEFFVRLTDEFYVERSSQLVLIYVSLDETEEKQDEFLKKMPKRWLFLPFLDEFKKELELKFSVKDPPVVVVLKPNGEVITANAVEEIKELGPACFQNWQEAAELVDRNFLLAEDFDNVTWRSVTDPLRRLKYKLKKKKRKKRSNQEEEEDEDEESS